jgi:penicillin-binding protein 2
MAREIPGDYYEQLTKDPWRPLFNTAISAENPPGSVFKMAAAIGILNEGVVKPEQQIEDPGKITIMQKFSPNDPGTPLDYVCWEKTGHGMVDFLHGVAWSCDVYWYKVGGGYKDEVPGNGLGIWRMGEYARALGYGKKSGIELPGEAKGLIPDPDWKRINLTENWATGDTYIATMGQGYVLATPLQVLESAATIANDGKLMQPTLVREVLDSDGNVIRPFTPKLVWDMTKDPIIHVYDDRFIQTGEMKTVAPWVLQKAKEGMRMVNEEGGTAADKFADAKFTSGGKTGTAEYCDNVAQAKNLCRRGSWPTHSWYMAFAPYDDPEIAVVAFIYNGGEGASVAAPVVRKVMDAYFCLKTESTSCNTE